MRAVGSLQSAVGRRGIAFFCLLLIFQLVTSNFEQVLAQSPAIKKSDKVETIDGKKFYVHSVDKGQTLYSIAKSYGTTVDIVLFNNPAAVEGLKSGDKLNIPVLGELPKGLKENKSAKTDSSKSHPAVTDPKKNAQLLPDPRKEAPVAEDLPPDESVHVAVFLPFSLSQIETIEDKLPEETKIGIEFYEGIKMAFDSLRRQGFRGFLHVYDSNVDSAGFARLMKKPELKEMDLLIGPLYGKKFETVLGFAKENNIAIVSPTLQANNILMGNTNVSKVMPSYATQADLLGKYVAEKYAGENILVFNSASPRDRPYINTFKKTANLALHSSNTDSVKEITFSTMKNFILHGSSAVNSTAKGKPNIVVIPSTNASFVTEAVNKLFLGSQADKDSIVIFGMSNFQDIESLDFGYLKQLGVSITSYTFVDYSDPRTKKFIHDYRKQFRTEPTQYVYLGFDVGHFYMGLIQKYGRYDNKRLPDIKEKGLQMEFNFFQSDVASGYENRGVGIVKLENFTYTRVK